MDLSLSASGFHVKQVHRFHSLLKFQALRVLRSSKEPQEGSAQTQQELGLSKSDKTIKHSEHAFLRHAKLRIKIEYPISYLAGLIRVRVGHPVGQRPQNFASGPTTTGCQ